MKFNLIVLAILVLSSCTLRKREQLNKIAYELGEDNKLIVNSLKRSEDRLEFKLLAISNGAYETVIKAKDIDCGVGKTKFKTVNAQSNPDNLIIIPKMNYLEMDVVCKNDKDVSEDDDIIPFLKFKRIYKLDGKKTGELLDENITIKFE